MTKITFNKKKVTLTILLSITLTFTVLASGLLLNEPQAASAFPTSAVATVFPNANGVGGHGVAVDSNGIVWYVPVGNGLIGQDPSFAPGDAAGILFRATPFNAVNNAVDNQDNIWISNSNGFVTKYDPVADSFTNFGPVVGCSFLDHIHFHSDGFVYTTCLDGNHIFQIDPVGGGIVTFLVPTANSATAGITGDVNGDLWTIERSAHKVVRGVLANMVPNTSNGVTEFPIPNPPYRPETVKACGDKVWFSGLSSGPNGPRVANIDINTLLITTVDLDPAVNTGTYGLTIDGNGNPFTTNPSQPKVYGVDTSAGNAVTIFATPSNVHHIAISPSGDLWYTDFSARITQLVLDEPLSATCLPTEPQGPVFLVIDEDSIDNDGSYFIGGTPQNFLGGEEFKFIDTDVNDDIAEIGERSQLPFFAANIDETITLLTGEMGDEAWFAPNEIPDSWEGLDNFILAAPPIGDSEDLLDKVPDVRPLRAEGLFQLIDREVCAVVFDSDISTNYDPLDGSLKGANYGIVAFKVKSVTAVAGLPDFSDSSLPEVEIDILDANEVCNKTLSLFDAQQKLTSSSEEVDVLPNADG